MRVVRWFEEVRWMFALGLIVLLVAAFTVDSGRQANAAGRIKDKSEYPEEIVQLVEKANDGPLDDDEAALLIGGYPELAAVTPDYRNVQSSDAVDVDGVEGAVDRAASCRTAAATVHAKTLLGATFYRMNTTVYYCWDGFRVTRIDNPNTSFSDVAATVSIRSQLQNRSWVRGGIGGAISAYEVANEVPVWGTWNVKHPNNTFAMYGDGRVNTWSNEYL